LSQFERNANAPSQPIGREDDFQFAEQVRDVKPARLKLSVGVLLRLPEIEILVFGGEPREREDGVHVMRRRKRGRTVLKTQSEGRTTEDRDFRGFGQVTVQGPENAQRIIHGGTASPCAADLLA